MRSPARVISSVLACSLALAVTIGSTPAQAATELLPDLRMRNPSNFYIQRTTNEKRLRFETIIWNAGAGKFEARMFRSPTETRMKVRQRIHRTDGTYRQTANLATYGFFAGDGHSHWHVHKLQEFTIRAYNPTTNTTDPTVRGRGVKTGFCFFDNVKSDLSLRGAPQTPRYSSASCGTKSSTALTEGLSVGWGDRYPATIGYQWIKINGLKDGKYRVQVVADPGNRFQEKSETNNSASAYIQITGNSVKVIAP